MYLKTVLNDKKINKSLYKDFPIFPSDFQFIKLQRLTLIKVFDFAPLDLKLEFFLQYTFALSQIATLADVDLIT